MRKWTIHNEPDDDRGTVLHTLDRGLRVLEAVASADGTATAKVISRRLGIKLGTCYHLLRTLLAGGYVVRIADGRYATGPRAASLAHLVHQRSGPSPALALILTRLHDKTREASYLAGWQHGTLILQHYLSKPDSHQVGDLDIGYTGRMHARASCKAVLANLPAEQLTTIFTGVALEAVTPHTITDYDELMVELTQVRRQGFALDRQEFSAGVYCVAAPYFGTHGRPAGAITVSSSADRFRQRQQWLTGAVREAAANATGQLRAGRVAVPAHA